MAKKTAFLINSFSQGQAKLSSLNFLNSHIDYGLWIRPLAIKNMLLAFADPNVSDVEKVSFEATLYTLFGSCLEDFWTSIIAMACWQHSPDKNLTDVFEQIQISPDDECKSSNHYTVIRDKIRTTTKRVRVAPMPFINSILSSVDVAKLPGEFGLDWRYHVNKSLFSCQEEKRIWQNFPKLIEEVLKSFSDPPEKLITRSYNKIKHGPQINVTSLGDQLPDAHLDSNVILCRSQTDVRLFDFSRTYPILQILFSGAAIGASEEEIISGRRSAPCVVPGVENMEKIFYRSLFPKCRSWYLLVSLMRNRIYPEFKRPISSQDKGIMSLEHALVDHIKKTNYRP